MFWIKTKELQRVCLTYLAFNWILLLEFDRDESAVSVEGIKVWVNYYCQVASFKRNLEVARAKHIWPQGMPTSFATWPHTHGEIAPWQSYLYEMNSYYIKSFLNQRIHPAKLMKLKENKDIFSKMQRHIEL